MTSISTSSVSPGWRLGRSAVQMLSSSRSRGNHECTEPDGTPTCKENVHVLGSNDLMSKLDSQADTMTPYLDMPASLFQKPQSWPRMPRISSSAFSEASFAVGLSGSSIMSIWLPCSPSRSLMAGSTMRTVGDLMKSSDCIRTARGMPLPVSRRLNSCVKLLQLFEKALYLPFANLAPAMEDTREASSVVRAKVRPRRTPLRLGRYSDGRSASP